MAGCVVGFIKCSFPTCARVRAGDWLFQPNGDDARCLWCQRMAQHRRKWRRRGQLVELP